MKPAKSAYLILAMGIFILTFCPILGSSLSAKLADIYGLHKTNKITATWSSNLNQPGDGYFSLENTRQLAQFGLRDHDIAYAAEVSTYAAYKKNQSRAQVLGVNDRYDQFHQINLIEGSFLTSAQENQQVAVIDEELARELFNNCRVVGLEIELYGRKFRIIGVAGDDPSLIGILTDRGYGTVYLPAKKLLELEADAGITSLEVATRDAGVTGSNTALLKTALASIGKDPDSYKIIDYNLESLLLKEKNLLFNFAAGAAALVALFGLLGMKVRGIYGFFRLRLREEYFGEILKKDRARLVIGMAEIIFLMAVMLLLGTLISFPLYIPPENIPAELIDLSFYADLFKNGIQDRVQSAGYIAPPGEIQLDTLATIQNWNLLLGLFLGLPLLYLGLFQVRLLGEELLKIEIFCCVFMVAALIIGNALIFIAKMPPMGLSEIFPVFISIFLTVIFFSVRREADGQFIIKKSIQNLSRQCGGGQGFLP